MFPNIDSIDTPCECTLTKGNKYDTTKASGIGWTTSDGEAPDGYNRWDYFDQDGIYLGPDEDGVEPLWDSSSILEL